MTKTDEHVTELAMADALALAADSQWTRRERKHWPALLAPEYDNVQTALAWSQGVALCDKA